MFKRVLVALILIVGVIALHRVDVDAHLAGTTYIPTYRHITSNDCTIHLKNVPHPNSGLFAVECETKVKTFQVMCMNKLGKPTKGNNVNQIVISIAGATLSPLDITDWAAGKAVKTLPLPDEVKKAADFFCTSRNLQWLSFDEFVKSVDVVLRSFEFVCPQGQPHCDFPVKVQAFEASLQCTAPEGFGLDPAVEIPPFPGLVFDCNLLSEVHMAQRQEGPQQPYSLNAGIHSLWNQARKALGMDRNEPQSTRLAQAARNQPVM